MKDTITQRVKPIPWYSAQAMVPLLCLVGLAGQAQTIENIRAVPRNDVIEIVYDLKAMGDANEYKISLYSSHNNYSSPVRFVTGDVGERVGVGYGKKITWAVKSEIGSFKGNLQFEVRGEPILPIKAFSFIRPVAGNVKRATQLTIEWTGGSRSENVQLQLMQNNQVKSIIGSALNTGTYLWKVPGNTAPGTYQLSLVGPSGTATSEPFEVTPKTSKWVKLAPLAIVAGVVIWQLIPDKKDDGLPAPPNRPD